MAKTPRTRNVANLCLRRRYLPVWIIRLPHSVGIPDPPPETVSHDNASINTSSLQLGWQRCRGVFYEISRDERECLFVMHTFRKISEDLCLVHVGPVTVQIDDWLEWGRLN